MALSIINDINLLKLLIPAEKDILEGNYSEAEDFFASFRKEKKHSPFNNPQGR